MRSFPIVFGFQEQLESILLLINLLIIAFHIILFLLPLLENQIMLIQLIFMILQIFIQPLRSQIARNIWLYAQVQ